MQTISFEEIGGEASIHKAALERLSKSFYSSKRVVALTGAGISVSAGIPVINKPSLCLKAIIYVYFRIFGRLEGCMNELD